MAILKTAAIDAGTSAASDVQSLQLDEAAMPSEATTPANELSPLNSPQLETEVDQLAETIKSSADRGSLLEELREHNERIENEQIFGADLLRGMSLGGGPSSRSSEQRLQAEQAVQQDGNSLSTNSKKKKGATGLASIDVVVQQLESIVPAEQIEALTKALKESHSSQGSQQVSSAELLNRAQEIATALKGTDTLLTLQNSGLSAQEAISKLLEAHIDDPELVEKGTRVILEALQAGTPTPVVQNAPQPVAEAATRTIDLGSEDQETATTIQRALESGDPNGARTSIVDQYVSVDRFVARQCQEGDYAGLRSLVEAKVVSEQELLSVLYAESTALYTERGELHARDLTDDYTAQERLTALNAQLLELEEQLAGVLQGSGLGREVARSFERAELQARMDGVLAQSAKLGRMAGMHEGLPTSRNQETFLANFRASQQQFLADYPEFAVIVQAQIEKARAAGRTHREDVERSLQSLDTALAQSGRETRTNAASQVLSRLDRDQIAILRTLYDNRHGEHIHDALTRRCGAESGIQQAYYAVDQRRHAVELLTERREDLLNRLLPVVSEQTSANSAAPELSQARDELERSINAALTEGNPAQIRAAISSTGMTPEEYAAKECRSGNYERVRALVDAGVVNPGEALNGVYAETRGLYAERGALLGNSQRLESEYDAQQRLETINTQLQALNQHFGDVFQDTSIGRQMQADFDAIERLTRAEAIVQMASPLAREAELNVGFRVAQGKEARLNTLLSSQREFLASNPQIASLVDAHLAQVRADSAEERTRLHESYKELRRVLRNESNPDNKVHAILDGLDRPGMELLREIHAENSNTHIRNYLSNKVDDSAAIDSAYSGAFSRRVPISPPTDEQFTSAAGAPTLTREAIEVGGTNLQLDARTSAETQRTVLAESLTQHRAETVSVVDQALERARLDRDYLPLALMRAQLTAEQWQAIESSYQREHGASLSLAIAELPDREMSQLIMRDAPAVLLAHSLHRELEMPGRAPDEAFATFARLNTGADVQRTLDAYRAVFKTTALSTIQSAALTSSDPEAAQRIATALESVKLGSESPNLRQEITALGRIEEQTIDPRERAAVEQGDQLTIAVFAIDRALQSTDPMGNVYSLTGGVDPALIEGFSARYQEIFGRPCRSPEEVVLERAQSNYAELIRKQERLGGGTSRNEEQMRAEYKDSGINWWFGPAVVYTPNFWRNVSGERGEIRRAANAFEREAGRQHLNARAMDDNLMHSREASEIALASLARARELEAVGSHDEARRLRLEAQGLMRNSLGMLTGRNILIESDEMRADMHRFSAGLDGSIQTLNDYERYIKTARNVVIVGGVIIATGGLASGTLAIGGGLGTLSGTAVGTKLAAFGLATIGGTAAGTVGNVAEQAMHIGYGNKTGGEALSDLGVQTYQDLKTSAIASGSTVVGLGVASRVGGLFEGTRFAGTQLAVLTTSGSAGASGGMFSTSVDMTATNVLEGGYQVVDADGRVQRVQFSMGEIATETGRSGLLGFVTGGIGGKAELMRNSARTAAGRAFVTTGEAVTTTGVGLGSSALQGNLSVDGIIQEVGFAGVGALQGRMAAQDYIRRNSPPQQHVTLGGELRDAVVQRVDQTITEAAQHRRLADRVLVEGETSPSPAQLAEHDAAAHRGVDSTKITTEVIRSVEEQLQGVSTISPELREAALQASSAETNLRVAQNERGLRLQQAIRELFSTRQVDLAVRLQNVATQLNQFVEAHRAVSSVAVETRAVRNRFSSEANVARETDRRALTPEMRPITEEKSRLEQRRAQGWRTVGSELLAPLTESRLPSLSRMREGGREAFTGTRFSEIGHRVQREFREARAVAVEARAVQHDAARFGSGVAPEQSTPMSRALDEAALQYAQSRSAARSGLGTLFREITAPIDTHAPSTQRMAAAWQQIVDGIPFSAARRSAASDLRQARANFNSEQRITRTAARLGAQEGAPVTEAVASELNRTAHQLAIAREANRFHLNPFRPKPQLDAVLGRSTPDAGPAVVGLGVARQEFRSARGAYDDQVYRSQEVARLSPKEDSPHAQELRLAAEARADEGIARRRGLREAYHEVIGSIQELRVPRLSTIGAGLSEAATHTRLGSGTRNILLNYFDVRGEHNADLRRGHVEARLHQDSPFGREDLAVDRANHFAGILADHARSIRHDIHQIAQEIRGVLYLKSPDVRRVFRAEADIPSHTSLNRDVRATREDYQSSRVPIEAEKARKRSLDHQQVDITPEERAQLSARGSRALASINEFAPRLGDFAAERARGWQQFKNEAFAVFNSRRPRWGPLSDGVRLLVANSALNPEVAHTTRAANQERATLIADVQHLRRRVELGWKPVEASDVSELARRQRNLNVEAVRVATTEGAHRAHRDGFFTQFRDPLSVLTRDGIGNLAHHVGGFISTSSWSRSARVESGRQRQALALRESEALRQQRSVDLARDAQAAYSQDFADARARNMQSGDDGRARMRAGLRGLIVEQRLSGLGDLWGGFTQRFSSSVFSSDGLLSRYDYRFVRQELRDIALARREGINLRPEGGVSPVRAPVPAIAPRDDDERAEQVPNDPDGPQGPRDPRLTAIDDEITMLRGRLAHDQRLILTADVDGTVDLGHGYRAPREAIAGGIAETEQRITELLTARDRLLTTLTQERLLAQASQRPQEQSTVRSPTEMLADLNERISGLRSIAAQQNEVLATSADPFIQVSPEFRMSRQEFSTWAENTRQELVALTREREVLELRIATAEQTSRERTTPRVESPAVPVSRTPEQELASLTEHINGLRQIMTQHEANLALPRGDDFEVTPGVRISHAEYEGWVQSHRDQLVDLVRQREMLEARIESPRPHPLRPNDPQWEAYQAARSAEVRAQAAALEQRYREIAVAVMRGPQPSEPAVPRALPAELSRPQRASDIELAVATRRAEFGSQLAELRENARSYESWLQEQRSQALENGRDLSVWDDELSLLRERRRAFDEVATQGRTATDVESFTALSQRIEQYGLMLENNRVVLDSTFGASRSDSDGSDVRDSFDEGDASSAPWQSEYDPDNFDDGPSWGSSYHPDSGGPSGRPGRGGGGGAATLEAPVRQNAQRRSPSPQGNVLRLSPEGAVAPSRVGPMETQNLALDPVARVEVAEPEVFDLRIETEEQQSFDTEEVSLRPVAVQRTPEAAPQRLPQAAPQEQPIGRVQVLERDPQVESLFRQIQEQQLQALLSPPEVDSPTRRIEIDGRPYVLREDTVDIERMTQRVDVLEQSVESEVELALQPSVRPEASVRVRPRMDLEPDLARDPQPSHRPQPRNGVEQPLRIAEEEMRRRDEEYWDSLRSGEDKKKPYDRPPYDPMVYRVRPIEWERNRQETFSAGLKKRVKNAQIIGEDRSGDILGNDANDPSRWHDEWIDT